MLKREPNTPGAVAASAKPCLYAITHIENFLIKNPLNSSLKKLKQYICAAVPEHKHLHTAMAAITARKSSGY